MLFWFLFVIRGDNLYCVSIYGIIRTRGWCYFPIYVYALFGRFILCWF